MQVCVHAVTLPCLCFCTYVLPLIMIYFPPNPVKYRLQSLLTRPNWSRSLTVRISHDCEWRSATVWLDKFVYFTLRQTPKKLSRSLRFVRKGIAAAKHANLNKNSYAVSYAFTVSFLLLQLINHVECWIHVLIAHLLLTAGKKMSLGKSLQIHAKSWKLLLNPEGCSYRRLCKQGNEGRKKKKIVNNEHLGLKNFYLPQQRRPVSTAQAHHLTGSCANVSHSLNK